MHHPLPVKRGNGISHGAAGLVAEPGQALVLPSCPRSVPRRQPAHGEEPWAKVLPVLVRRTCFRICRRAERTVPIVFITAGRLYSFKKIHPADFSLEIPGNAVYLPGTE